jgi:hypothetical protein
MSSISGFNSNPIAASALNDIVGSAVNLAVQLNGGNTAAAAASLQTLFGGAISSLGSQPVSNAATSQPLPSMSTIFGNNAFQQQQQQAVAAALAGASSGPVTSLGQLLAIVGTALTSAMQSTMNTLRDAANQLAQQTQKSNATALTPGATGSPNAAGGGLSEVQLNQKIQELTFNLQQLQQTLNRVNETVTNISKSASDAQSTTARNLAV